MFSDPAIRKEIKHIAIGIGAGSVVTLGVCTGLGFFSPKLLMFALIGACVAMFGFLWLCYSVQKTLEKGDKAKGYMTKNYLGRMVLYAGWVAISFKFGGSYPVMIAGALPVFYPSFTIKLMNLFKSSKKEEE